MSEVMTLSPQGIQALKNYEALKTKAYQDTRKVWTIGYGHTGTVNGVPVGAGMTITPQQAEELFKARLPEFENAVRSSVKQPLTQNQYDALVSLAYNIGANGFKKSGIVRMLNLGDYQGAADKLLEYSKERDPKTNQLRFNQGLLNRREKERAMFLGQGNNIKPPQNTPSFSSEPYDVPIRGNNTPQQPTTSQPVSLAEQFANFGNPQAMAKQVQNPLESEPLKPFEPLQNYRKQYQKQLASAFGIEPETQDQLPNYIGDLVKSIYDQTA